MSIYIVHFNDSGEYAAYTSKEKAKQVLWDAYCDDVSEEVRSLYIEEDKATFANDYITDYGWVTEISLFDSNGEEISI